jgi:hypothetical protein
LLAGPLQVTSYNVAAQIPTGDKADYSQKNAVLRLIEQAFGNQLRLAYLLKKSQQKALFLDTEIICGLDLCFPYAVGRIGN